MVRPVAAMFFLILLSLETCTLRAQTDKRYFTIKAIDQKTGRGIPMVEFKTASQQRYFTDSNGLIAFDDPGLMNEYVRFAVFTHGYQIPKDISGNHDVVLKPIPGDSVIVKLKRTNVAERLYRITGQDIYGESQRLGSPIPIKHQGLNGKVLGQDTFIETAYKNKLYWFWGDTFTPAGFNGAATGATSELPGSGGLDPSVGIDLTYFIDGRGVVKPMCPFRGETLVWIGWLVTLPNDRGEEQLYAEYTRIDRAGNPSEKGIGRFNDSSETFERVKIVQEWLRGSHRTAHPFVATVDSRRYIYLINYDGIARVEADVNHLTDPGAYEYFTCFAPRTAADTTSSRLDRDNSQRLVYGWKANAKPLNHRQQEDLVTSEQIRSGQGLWQLQDVVSGQSISVDPASVFWNAFRKRWVMIAYEFTGGAWFFEGDTPTGPWTYGSKIVSHQRYDFYNIGQHPLLDQEGGRLIYFEGTYTTGYSGSTDPTPLYDYNQVMYRLALDDPRLSLPAPVYLVRDSHGREQYLMRDAVDSLGLWEQIRSIPFYAIPPARGSDEHVPVYAVQTNDGPVLTTSLQPSQTATLLFYALASDTLSRERRDPISGSWKCMAIMSDSAVQGFSLELEKDGEEVSGTNVAEGHYADGRLSLTLRILDYTMTANLTDGMLRGTYRKDDGTETGSWSGGRVAAQAVRVSPAVLELYEFPGADGAWRTYSVDPTSDSGKKVRSVRPLCKVWRNPSSVLALDYQAKPVSFVR